MLRKYFARHLFISSFMAVLVTFASLLDANSDQSQVGDKLDSARSPLTSESTSRHKEKLHEKVRNGRYPAQLVGHIGTIQPGSYGPNRTESRERLPKHAYLPFDESKSRTYPCPQGACEVFENSIAIKFSRDVKVTHVKSDEAVVENSRLNKALTAHRAKKLRPIFPGAKQPKAREVVVTPEGIQIPKPDLTKWHRVSVEKGEDIYAAIENLRKEPGIEWAEPVYIRHPSTEDQPESSSSSGGKLNAIPSASSDPLYNSQWHLAAANIPAAWQWLEQNSLPPGGSRDIIIAVIDSGVDYTHPDLAANIWTNSREIAGNGIDDDGDGFIDDVHGVDVVSNDGDPMDDHGHGTHVAGIIAAQADNGMGGAGVAYNTQIMAIKAAQYSGILTTTDIAEGIYYAVEHGADVINMSFGGYTRSQVEEDALAVAFGQAVLVAAAGNDGKPNLPCPGGRDMYPAAYNWVLGVMASEPGGGLAGFSNSECTPHDSHEYEVMAPGVDVYSTLPNENYAAWDGTSMAAPIVSGIAALLRTKWTDKDVYSSRFIMGQIAANGANALADLTVTPQPELSYLEHWLFDTSAQNEIDDADGVVDAGEAIDLAVVIRNHWGKADSVSVKLEAVEDGAYQPDPYVNIEIDTVDYGAVGSFNQDDNGLIYDDEGVITGVDSPFRFNVSSDCPNDHVIPFRLTMTARNGLDPADGSIYTSVSNFYVIVQRGRELPRIISEDTTLTKDYYWIVPGQVRINSGVTVRISEGTQVQWGTQTPQDPYAQPTTANLLVYGNLLITGTYDEPVELFPDPLTNPYGLMVNISTYSPGTFHVQYAKVDTPNWDSNTTGPNSIDHCILFQDKYTQEGTGVMMLGPPRSMTNTIFLSSSGLGLGGLVPGTTDTCLFEAGQSGIAYHMSYNNAKLVTNSVFLQNNSLNSTWGLYWSNCYDKCFDTELEASNNTQSINNAFLSKYWDPNPNHWMRTSFQSIPENKFVGLSHNYWGTTSTTLIDVAIKDLHDVFGVGTLVYQPILTTPATSTYPFVVDVQLSTASQSDTNIVGAEPVTFTVTFNRDMDNAVQPSVSFGPDTPVTDYTVHPIGGGWTDSRTWVGTFNITPITGDGYQLIRVAGARAADDPWLVTGNDAGRFRFEIITSGSEAMNLQGNGGEGYVDLTWTQDDFDLLAGFNLYRSTSPGGNFTQLNTTLIPVGEQAYRDINVTPGQPYYYKFTVVKSDFSESDFSNVAAATPTDTLSPTLTHSPVTSATPGQSLTIYADATDNVQVTTVTLYYRNIGQSVYSSRGMVKTTGNRYSATLEGSLLTSPGLEYYLEAFDDISVTRSGRPDFPWQVAVVDKPVVNVVSPVSGPAAGGTSVTISGTNFKDGAVVRFGGASCSDITILSSNQISCVTPAHFPSTVDVEVENPDGQNGTLLHGFTFASDIVEISLPESTGGQHAIITIPININNIVGMASASLTITYDSNVLNALGATTGSITSDWSLAANTSTAGQVRLSLASPGGTVSGSGTAALIEFDVIGAAGATSALTFTSVSLNDGAIPIQQTDGNFTVNQLFSLSGKASFWKDAAPVPGVMVTLSGDRIYNGTSDSSGMFSITNIPTDDYTLTPTKPDGVQSISAYDASLALQHDAGLITLSGPAAIAGDVNKSSAITAMDAFLILQKSVDLIELPFSGAGVVWEFSPALYTYSSLAQNMSSQNFTAILLGDISGNWSDSGQTQMNVVSNIQQQTGNSILTSNTLIVPETTLPLNGQSNVSIVLDPGITPFYSVNLEVNFDPAVVRVLSVEKSPLTETWSVVNNLADPGRVTIGMAGATPITTSGDLAKIRFEAIGPTGAWTYVSLTNTSIDESSIPVTSVNGKITIISPIEKGDLNGDGNVDLTDALIALKIITGQQLTTVNISADVNMDGKIDLVEVNYILRKMVGALQ